MSGGIRDDDSLERGAGHRLRPGQHRHRRAGEARLGRPGSSPSTATRSRSASTCAARPWPPGAGPARAATSTRRWPASTPRAAPATWSPTSSRTARSAAPTWTCYRDVCARTDAPVVASGGVSSLDDLRALASLVRVGVEGAIVGKALYAGAFTLEEALAAVAA